MSSSNKIIDLMEWIKKNWMEGCGPQCHLEDKAHHKYKYDKEKAEGLHEDKTIIKEIDFRDFYL